MISIFTIFCLALAALTAALLIFLDPLGTKAFLASLFNTKNVIKDKEGTKWYVIRTMSGGATLYDAQKHLQSDFDWTRLYQAFPDRKLYFMDLEAQKAAEEEILQ